jgi:PTH1 family peptidyl-tRNA hydrolase
MARTQPHLVLICLGNPGPDYAGTRHNAGWMFADWLAQRHGFGPFKPYPDTPAEVAAGELAGLPALLVKPRTLMNESGRLVGPLAADYPFDDHLWCIAHDDLDVPLGRARARGKGGHGGHNGVRSVLGAAGRRDLARLKLGVDSPARAHYEAPADFLLDEFAPAERERLEQSFPAAQQALEGQAREFAARLERERAQARPAAHFAAECLDAARRAVADLPFASPYPVFLPRRALHRVTDVTVALAKLLRKAAAGLAEDDAFYERLLGYIPANLRPLLGPRRRLRRLLFATDFHVAGGEVRVIELNCAVGFGHYAHLAARALAPVVRPLGVRPAADVDFAPFLWEHGLKPLHEPERGRVAFLRGIGNRDMFNADELEGVAARIAETGGPQIALVHEADLALRDEGLYTGCERVDLLYVEENLGDWARFDAGSPVPGAVRAGLVKTFPRLDMFLLTSKGALCALIDPECERVLRPDDAERRVLRENVLWSHELDAHIEPAAYYMLREGLALVVKDALGGGGRGVDVLHPDGSGQAGHTLRSRLRAAQDGRHPGSIVQGYFAPGPWGDEPEPRFDVRVLCAAHEGDIAVGPIYGRIFRGVKLSMSSHPDAGVAAVYVSG